MSSVPWAKSPEKPTELAKPSEEHVKPAEPEKHPEEPEKPAELAEPSEESKKPTEPAEKPNVPQNPSEEPEKPTNQAKSSEESAESAEPAKSAEKATPASSVPSSDAKPAESSTPSQASSALGSDSARKKKFHKRVSSGAPAAPRRSALGSIRGDEDEPPADSAPQTKRRSRESSADDQPQTAQTEEPEDRKLKRPKRRGDINEQLRRAEELRKQDEMYQQKFRQTALEARKREHVAQLGLNNIVREFYNARTSIAKVEQRNLSPIIRMRNFNNAIKYILIGNFAKPGDAALDLGCGKGGDLFKWLKAEIGFYVGIDISDASITEAIRRYKSIRRNRYEALFVVGDAFGEPIQQVLAGLNHPFPFDIVSTQFCLHYAFQSEKKIRQLLVNVSASLRKGGYFVGTIPSSDFITAKIRQMPPGELGWGNSVYSVKFDQPVPKNGEFPSPFGNMYTFYLEDAIDNVPEYVVPFDVLRSLALEYNLELKYEAGFTDLFQEEIGEWYRKLPPKLVEGMKRDDGSYGLQGDEAEASNFYKAFVFQKIGL